MTKLYILKGWSDKVFQRFYMVATFAEGQRPFRLVCFPSCVTLSRQCRWAPSRFGPARPFPKQDSRREPLPVFTYGDKRTRSRRQSELPFRPYILQFAKQISPLISAWKVAPPSAVLPLM